MNTSRRKFLQGCSLSIAALAGARITRAAFAQPGAKPGTLVVVFLRGGWDALNVLPPLGNDHALYEAARPSLKIPAGSLLELDGNFGLHPAMAPVHELYQDGKAAFVHAVGLDVDTRSHFDAMEFIELGTPGQKSNPSGWITRHLQSSSLNGAIPIAAVPTQSTALLNQPGVISLNTPDNLSQWDNGLLQEQQAILRQMYAGSSPVHQAGLSTLDVLQVAAPMVDATYTPANGIAYLDDEFGQQMQGIAQLIKMGTGLQIATVDFGGWDTHEDQNNAEGGYMAGLLESLSGGLSSFYHDLEDGYAEDVSVIVLSEFGRRLAQNDSRGTDHGHGSVMLALGAGVNGGQVYGRWPGLANEQLYDRADLAVTTDFRQVLGELLVKRLKNPDVAQVFPGYTLGETLGLYQE